jgi:hypothetical protein
MTDPILSIARVYVIGETDGAELRVEYTLENPGSEALFADNLLKDPQLLKPATRSPASSEAAYVFHDGRSSVVLSAGDGPEPRFHPMIHYFPVKHVLSSMIPPKRMIRATVRERLPLNEWHAQDFPPYPDRPPVRYPPAPPPVPVSGYAGLDNLPPMPEEVHQFLLADFPRTVTPVTVTSLVLRVAYAFASDLSERAEENADDHRGAYSVKANRKRVIEQSAALPEPLTLLRRVEDNFRRPAWAEAAR